jgi:hypothetical protein
MNAFARTLALGVAGKAQTFATVASLAGASLGMSEKAEAVLMLPGQSAQSYLDLGATAQGRQGYLSAIGSNGQQLGGYASVTFINPYYAVTAAHVVGNLYQNGGYARIGTGGNFNSDPGQVVDAYEAVFYPTYQTGVDTNNPDIVILKLATPLAGVSQVSYGTANPFDVVTSFGYGFAFFAGDPIVQPDGFRRGWNAPVRSDAPLFGSNTWYNSTSFGGGAGSAVPVNGKGLSGDSGGGVYNSQGQLVGINFGQTGNGASLGTTSYLDLSQPEVLSWLQANTVIPTPGTVGLLGLAALGMRGRRRA